MMKYLKLFLLSFVVGLLITSCSKDEFTETDLKQDQNTFANLFEEIDTSKSIEIDPNKKGTLLYNEQISLSKGQYQSVYIKKYLMSPLDIFILELTPSSGNADALIFGYSPWRHIRSSRKSGLVIDDVHLRNSDLKGSESRGYFIAYARTNTTFNMKIYRVAETNCSINNIPLYTQNNNYSCGHRSVKMVLAHQGINVSMNSLYNRMGRDFTNAYQRVDAIEHFGNISADVGIGWTIDHIRNNLCQGKHVIADLYLHGYAHSVVVTKVDESKVYYNDPFYQNGGRRSMSINNFVYRWNLNNYPKYNGVSKYVVAYFE